jgi:transcriptional regulator with XRE-family HTH domain
MENNDNKRNLFDELRDMRVQKGISLADVAEKSRIQLKYLESLEKGDILKIPEVYDKLFFRSYLKALDIAEEQYFERFLEYRRTIRVDRTTSVIQVSKSSTESDKKIFSHRNLFVLLPFSLLIFVIVLLLINTEMIDNAPEGKVQEIDIKNIVERLEARELAKVDSVQQTKRDTLALFMNISARRKTWFRLVTDKRDTSEYLLLRGQRIDRKADSTFEFLIGRADGLQIALNGKDLKIATNDSSVVTYMLIDSSGVVVRRLKNKNAPAQQKKSNENI